MSNLTTKAGNPVLSLSELRAFDSRAKERPGESDFCCPFCGNGKPVDQAHRSLSVNLENGAWNCHRCDQKGKLKEFWTEMPLADTGGTRRRAPSTPKPLKLPPLARRDDAPPPEFIPIAERCLPLAGTPGADYLAARGLPLALCEAAGTCYAVNWFGRPAVIFPIVNLSGQEVAAQGRYLASLPGQPKFYTEGAKRNGVFVAPGAWDADEITITEAPIDALTLCLSGYPALALVGKSWPEWLPAFVASTRKRVYSAFDADEPDAKGIRAGDEAASNLAEALRYYDAYSERLRPGRAKDWNAQLLEVTECRRLTRLLTKQISFLEVGAAHPILSRTELLGRAWNTLEALTAACVAADGPEALGYNDGPLDPFALDSLALWEHSLKILAEKV